MTIIMPENTTTTSERPHPPRSSDNKNKMKMKKKKKIPVSSGSAANTKKPQAQTETLSTPHGPDQPSSGLAVKHQHDDSPTPLEFVSELSKEARETLRWEGALDDPEEEEKRLETYRENRRQRYIKHAQTLERQTSDSL